MCLAHVWNFREYGENIQKFELQSNNLIMFFFFKVYTQSWQKRFMNNYDGEHIGQQQDKKVLGAGFEHFNMLE